MTEAEISAGFRKGSRMCQNTCGWEAPRSNAASSCARSNRWSLAMMMSSA